MGVDLQLLIIDEVYNKDTLNWWLGFNRLNLKREYDLYDCFCLYGREDNKHECKVNLKEIPFNKRVDMYRDNGIENNVDTDTYGADLKYFYAKDSKNIKVDYSKVDWNRAIIKFIHNLPDKTIIIPYWH